MAEQDQNREDEGPQAPASFVKALNNVEKERLFVPPALDELVLRKAREHLQEFERPQFGRKPWVSWAAMAACLALAFWLGERLIRSTGHDAFAPEDINRDGRVDILDAFALARRIETGGTADLRWDINGDGRVDRADVNAIAARAVSLAQAGPASKRSADLSPHRAGAVTVWRSEVRAPFFGSVVMNANPGLRVNVLPASCRQVLQPTRSQPASEKREDRS